MDSHHQDQQKIVISERSYFFSFMQHNGAMFNGAMNILHQNLIVSNGKVVRVHFL